MIVPSDGVIGITIGITAMGRKVIPSFNAILKYDKILSICNNIA